MPLKNGIVFDAGLHDPEDPLDEVEGIYLFDDLIGQLQPRTKQLEVTTRHGVGGETLRNTGVRAKPSTLVSVHYVLDREAARNAIEAYLQLIDGAPHELYQHGFSWGMVRVADVTPLPLQAVASCAGTLIGPSATICQQIVWTLIATYVPEEA